MSIQARIFKFAKGFYQENPDGSLSELTEAAVQELIDAGADVIDFATPTFSLIFETIFKGIISGMQSGYNYAREQIRGKEDDAVTGIVVTAVTLGSIVYIFRTLKDKGD